MWGKIKDQLLPNDQKVIFGFGNYFENVTGEEQQRITKETLFVSLLISIRIHACLHVETYSLTNKNGACHIYVY